MQIDEEEAVDAWRERKYGDRAARNETLLYGRPCVGKQNTASERTEK